MSPASEASRAYALALNVMASAQGTGLDGEWASDHWQASRLGVPARRGRGAARFDTITQGWLREPAKRWSRFRLATGCAFSTISAGALAISRFSGFLSERLPRWVVPRLSPGPCWRTTWPGCWAEATRSATRALTLSMLRVFFDACHRHGWLPGLAPNATIYVEELPFHHDEISPLHTRVRDGPARVRGGPGQDPQP